MSFCNRVVLPILAAASLAFLVACGSSSNHSTPPPTGAFSNSNLSGTYVFSTLGTDPSSGVTMTMAGAFTACGCSAGTISAGTFDYFDPSVALQTGQTISSGSYNVGQDGRGTITLLNSSTLGTFHLDFVLNGTGGGQVSEFDTFGSGSGTLVQQQSSVTPGSNYAYSVSGENIAGFVASGAAPLAYAQAGAFTLSSSGSLSNTSYDLTEEDLSSGAITNIANSGFTAGSSLTVGTGTTPGQASFTDPSNGNIYTFDVFAISANDLKLFETDTVFAAVGDAFPQATSLPSGTLAFTMNGVDTNIAPLSVGGLLTLSGNSITSGIEDYNDSGTANTDSSVGGGFGNNGTIVDGRIGLQLTAFYNGVGSQNSNQTTFAAYPTTNGTLLIEVDGVGITAGNALVQTNTSLASAQGYGVDISALNIGTGTIYEEDDIAEFTSTSTGFSGLVDVNDEGQTTGNNPPTFDGTYSSISTGRYQFAANSNGAFNGVSGAVYTVDGSTLLFLEGDNFQVGTGMFQVQNASGSDAQAAQHVPVFRGLLSAKNALKHRQK
jgi:hypothetical protein